MNFNQPPQPIKTLENLGSLVKSLEERRAAAVANIRTKGVEDLESVKLINEWQDPIRKVIEEIPAPIEGRLAQMRLDIETAVLYAKADMYEYALEMLEGALMAPKTSGDDERFDDIYEEMLILEDDLRQAVLGRQSESGQEE
jgi:hypothetical protein